MAQVQAVFRRVEKKYRITASQHLELTRKLQGVMNPDCYGRSTVGSIYFDTPDYRLIRASIEKPVYKEKLRMRCYGTPGPDDNVFVELKKKYNGVVYKRRVPMTLHEAENYLFKGLRPRCDCQILREIDWFMQFYRPVPKLYIAYDRTALYGAEDPELRITFDTNIRFREHSLSLSKGDLGTQLLRDAMILMEIKTPGSIPMWLTHILSEMKIYPNSYSKYGTCYLQYLLPVSLKTGGIHCA